MDIKVSITLPTNKRLTSASLAGVLCSSLPADCVLIEREVEAGLLESYVEVVKQTELLNYLQRYFAEFPGRQTAGFVGLTSQRDNAHTRVIQLAWDCNGFLCRELLRLNKMTASTHEETSRYLDELLKDAPCYFEVIKQASADEDLL